MRDHALHNVANTINSYLNKDLKSPSDILWLNDRCIFVKKFKSAWAGSIDLKRITRCKLALIFTSADIRKFLGLFGSEAARL